MHIIPSLPITITFRQIIHCTISVFTQTVCKVVFTVHLSVMLMLNTATKVLQQFAHYKVWHYHDKDCHINREGYKHPVEPSACFQCWKNGFWIAVTFSFWSLLKWCISIAWNALVVTGAWTRLTGVVAIWADRLQLGIEAWEVMVRACYFTSPFIQEQSLYALCMRKQKCLRSQ